MIKKLLLKTIIFALLISVINIGDTNSRFTSQQKIENNILSSGCWVAPSVPQLVYPTNPTFAGAGSPWDKNPYMDWDNSTTSCPLATTISYQYESYRDSALTQLAYRSTWLTNSQIPAPGTPDGVYYWRVRAKDSLDNISDFSLPWKLVVDRVSPSVPSLSITGSYTKSVEEKIDPANWTIAGQVTSISSDTISTPDTTINSLDGSMFRIGTPDDPGNLVWENRLMQSFDTGAKSLSLKYNFFSRDDYPWDQPGFFIRLNGQEIFRQNNLGSDGDIALSTGWTNFYYDLSSQTNSQTNLAIYAGNTFDNLSQSWAYVDQITTYFVSAPLHASYSFSAPETDIDRFEYSLDDVLWHQVGVGSTFTMPLADSYTLWYRSIDHANNHSPTSIVKIIVDNTPPSAITDLLVTDSSVNSATLNWTAPGNDGLIGRASRYELKYSLFADLSNPVFVNLPSPQSAGNSETFKVTGLNPETTYYFALKSADEAPNWSDISNIAIITTPEGQVINLGDIIVNEIHWIGGTNPEQLIEIKNHTDRHFTDLSLLSLKLGGTEVVNFSGTTLPPHGYLLVSTLNNSNTNIGPSTTIDIENASYDLSRTLLDLVLYHNSDQIDFAWTILEPVTEGVFDQTLNAEKYYSVERTSEPGAGDDPLNWYTCIDSASSADYFKVVPGVDFRGTPRADNRSENEPLSHLRPASRPTPTSVPSLLVNLSAIDIDNNITLTLANLTVPLDYEIIYTNSVGQQGFAGVIDSADIIDNQFSRQFYLGTCSSNGVCTPDIGIGSSATVILTGPAVNLNQTFIISP